MGPGAEEARRLASYADGRAANPFESALRAIALESRLQVIPQYAVQVGGVTYHPDLADPLRGILLEADSWAWHGNEEAFQRDCVRYNALAGAGWLVLRFTWKQVMHSPSYVLASIRAADLGPPGTAGPRERALSAGVAPQPRPLWQPRTPPPLGHNGPAHAAPVAQLDRAAAF